MARKYNLLSTIAIVVIALLILLFFLCSLFFRSGTALPTFNFINCLIIGGPAAIFGGIVYLILKNENTQAEKPKQNQSWS